MAQQGGHLWRLRSPPPHTHSQRAGVMQQLNLVYKIDACDLETQVKTGYKNRNCSEMYKSINRGSIHQRTEAAQVRPGVPAV